MTIFIISLLIVAVVTMIITVAGDMHKKEQDRIDFEKSLIRAYNEDDFQG